MSYKTIYIVTSGEYSDYHINAVFDSKQLAEEYTDSRAERYYPKPQIEKYPLNKYVNLQYTYEVTYDPWEPDTKFQWRIERQDEGFIPDNQPFNSVTTSKPHFNLPEDRARFYNAVRYTVWVKAKTRDAALKIANEKIMMFIAMKDK